MPLAHTRTLQVPCTTCVKRGQPDLCTWDDDAAAPEAYVMCILAWKVGTEVSLSRRQPFALASQYHDVCERLADIESFLQTLPPELRAGAPRAVRRPRRASTPPEPKDEPRSSSSPHIASTEVRQPLHCLQELPLTSCCSVQMVEVAVKLEDSAFVGATDAGYGRDAESLDHLVSSANIAPVQALDFATHPEPTKELTSILASPIPFVDASSAVVLGLDFCTTAEEMYAQRAQALDKVFATFPQEELSRALVRTVRLRTRPLLLRTHTFCARSTSRASRGSTTCCTSRPSLPSMTGTGRWWRKDGDTRSIPPGWRRTAWLSH